MELPFNTPEFAEAWAEWIEYKKQEYDFDYTEKGHNMALKKIKRLSYGNEEIAIAIIENSIERKWEGFFSLDRKDPLMMKLNEAKSQKRSASDILFEQLGINQ